jgi:hypothetical protein
VGPWNWKGKGNTPPSWNTLKCRLRSMERAIHSFLNSIPINKDSRQPAGKPDKDKIQDPYKQPDWLEEFKEKLTIAPTSEEHAALGAIS